MSNHYHLQLESREANLSKALHWLNVSYSVWFNRKYNRGVPEDSDSQLRRAGLEPDRGSFEQSCRERESYRCKLLEHLRRRRPGVNRLLLLLKIAHHEELIRCSILPPLVTRIICATELLSGSKRRQVSS
jgi:hypothetical protein